MPPGVSLRGEVEGVEDGCWCWGEGVFGQVVVAGDGDVDLLVRVRAGRRMPRTLNEPEVAGLIAACERRRDRLLLEGHHATRAHLDRVRVSGTDVVVPGDDRRRSPAPLRYQRHRYSAAQVRVKASGMRARCRHGQASSQLNRSYRPVPRPSPPRPARTSGPQRWPRKGRPDRNPGEPEQYGPGRQVGTGDRESQYAFIDAEKARGASPEAGDSISESTFSVDTSTIRSPSGDRITYGPLNHWEIVALSIASPRAGSSTETLMVCT